MNMTTTELLLLVWAAVATAAAFNFRGRAAAITKVLYVISTNKAMREEFFATHDAIFGAPK